METERLKRMTSRGRNVALPASTGGREGGVWGCWWVGGCWSCPGGWREGCHRSLLCSSSQLCMHLLSLITMQKQLPCPSQSVGAETLGSYMVSDNSSDHKHSLGLQQQPRITTWTPVAVHAPLPKHRPLPSMTSRRI